MTDPSDLKIIYTFDDDINSTAFDMLNGSILARTLNKHDKLSMFTYDVESLSYDVVPHIIILETV